MGTLRIATRASKQATTQASIVAAQLDEAGYHTELVTVDTYGDQTQADNIPLHSIGGHGVFVKAVQQAVLDGNADIAVHSAKDLPTAPLETLTIGAYCERRSPNDALIGRSLVDLDPGATVATGSVRRRSQLERVRPDLSFAELRGNIDTRIAKLPADGSVVVALAALELLGLADMVADVLDPLVFVPAVGQGCVAVEHRADDQVAGDAVASVDHIETRRRVEVERAFLAELGTGCSAPVGAFADQHHLTTYLAGETNHQTPHQVVSEQVSLGPDHTANMAMAADLARTGMATLRQQDRFDSASDAGGG